MRIKVKNKSWLAINKLSKGGKFFYKDLYDLVVSGEDQEVEIYYPAIKEKCLKLKSLLDVTKENINKVYTEIRDEVSQKEFALALAQKTPPLAWLLFECRRHNLTVEEVFRSARYAEKVKRGILELLTQTP